MIVPALWFGMLQTPELPPRDRGVELLEACKAAVNESPDYSNPDDMLKIGSCLGFIEGYMEARTTFKSGGTFCINGYASYGTLAKVYVAYMSVNPKFLDTYKTVGFELALRDAYPCPKTTSRGR